MSNWDGNNRRRFPRVNYPCQIVIRQKDGKDIMLAHTENVGVGGVCLIFKQDIKIFTTVELELDLLDLENHIKCPGRVVWAIRRKSEEANQAVYYDIGIEFVDLSDKDRQRIEKVIDKISKQGKTEAPI